MSNKLKDLPSLKKENENLKDLLSQVYDMSRLDEMINDGFKDRNNDESLGRNLTLRSQIRRALYSGFLTKKETSLINRLSDFNKAARTFTGHSYTSDKSLDKHYTSEPIKFTNSNKPIKIRSN